MKVETQPTCSAGVGVGVGRSCTLVTTLEIYLQKTVSDNDRERGVWHKPD